MTERVATTLAGRDGELALLGAALASARSGAGRLVVITGEPGIGKSSLAQATVAAAHDAGLRVLRGQAIDDPGAPPLWPWTRAARAEADLLQAVTLTTGGESDLAARFRMFDAAADALRAAASPAGLVVLLEDLHWADRTSVLLLRHLADELGDIPVLVLATARDGGALDEVLPDLIRSSAVRVVHLVGLTEEAVAGWLDGDPALRRWSPMAGDLQRRTGGNPLFLALLLQALPDHSAETTADAAALLGRVLDARADLREVVTRPLTGLPGPVRRVVDGAAVLAEQVWPSVLSAVLDEDEADIRAALAVAVAAGVLVAAPDGLAFRHAVIRDAVYAELDPATRADLHRRTASALAALARPPAGPVAAHWFRAGGDDGLAAAVLWAGRATEQARGVSATAEAVRFAELAVRAESRRAGPVDPAVRAELTIQLAQAHYAADDVAAALEEVVRAAGYAESAGRPDLLGQAASVIRGIGSLDLYGILEPMCRRASDLLPPDHPLQARLLAQLAVAAVESGRPDGGDRAAAAVEAAERAGDPEILLEALSARHLSLVGPGTAAERLAVADRAAELGPGSASVIGELWAHLWRVDAHFEAGDLAAVDRDLREIRRIADHRHAPVARWHHLRLSATRSALTGDFAAARADTDAAFALARQIGDVSTYGMYFAFRTRLAMTRGSPDDLPDGLLQAVAASPPLPLIRATVPVVLALTGDRAGALAAFAEFRTLPAVLPRALRWFPTMMLIGDVAVLLDDAEVAEQVLTLVRPLGRRIAGDGSGAVYSVGSNALFLGDLARVAGRQDEAMQWYAQAVTIDEVLGARPFTALARLGWAQAAVIRETGAQDGPPVSVERSAVLQEARRSAQQAAAEFARLDMPGPATRAATLLARLAGGTAALTAREREVAALVARGCSNRDIAARLVLSERTVESHVRSILTKLDMRSRTDIAVWAVRTTR